MANFDNDIQLSVGLNTNDVTRKAEELDRNIHDIFQRTSGSDDLSNSFRNLLNNMDKASKRSRDIREQMQQYEGATVPTNEYAMYESALEKLQTRLGALNERMQKFRDLGGNLNSRTFQSMQYDADRLREQIADIYSEMRNLRTAGQAFMPAVDTTEYADLVERLNQCNNALTIYSNRASEAEGTTSQFGEHARGTVNRLSGSLGKLVSLTTKVTANLAKMAGNYIRKGITSLANSIKSLGHHTKSSNNGLQVGFKNLIRYGFGVRSVFALVNKLRRALLEAFENLGEYDTEFGATITRFKESLETLKNSFASAFAPVVQVVLPILTQLMDKLSAVVTLVGKFIAALTGKAYFTQATRAQKQYKKSIDDTGKAAKEAKRELYGFDEITKQQDDSDTSSSKNNGDTGTDDIVGGFKTVPIDSWLKDLADKIRNFFKSKDWVGLGTFLGESINGMFQKAKDLLDNKKLLNKIYEVIDAITTTFNSLVSAIDWPLIGSTFASGVNLITNSLDRLITGVNWKNLGTSIATGLNSLVNDIDWNKVGGTVGNALNIIPQTISNFFATVNWRTLGENFATALNSMINNIDWKSVGGLVYNGINGVLDNLNGVIKTFNWRDTAKKIADTINNIFKNIDWKEASKFVADAVKSIFNSVAEFLEDVEWGEVADTIAEFLVKIDWGKIVQAVYEAVGAAFGFRLSFFWGLIKGLITKIIDSIKNALTDGGKEVISGFFNGIIEAVKGIGTWIKEHIVDPFIEGFKKAFGISSPSKVMAEQGGYVIQGLLNGILNGIKNIGAWIKDKIFGPIANGIKTAFGIAGGIAKNVVEFGKSVIGGIKNGITNAANSAGSWIKTNVFTPIKNSVNTAFGIVGGVAKNLVETGKSMIAGIKNGASNTWNTVQSVFQTGVNNIQALFKVDWLGVGATVVRGIYNGVSNIWGNVTNFFGRAVGTIKSMFINQNWFSIGSNICNGIRNGLATGANYVVQTARNVASRVLNAAKRFLGIRSPSTVFRDEVGQMISRGLALGIDDKASNAIKSVSDLSKSLTEEAMTAIKVPSIVTGNVVPYASTSGSQTAQDSAMDSMLDKLAPIIQDAMLTAIAQSDGFNVNFRITEDANKLFNVIRERGLQFQQMTGRPVFD